MGDKVAEAADRLLARALSGESIDHAEECAKEEAKLSPAERRDLDALIEQRRAATHERLEAVREARQESLRRLNAIEADRAGQRRDNEPPV